MTPSLPGPPARTALVTGASSGIGRDTAAALAAAGFTVYAVARRLEPMEPLTRHGIRIFAMDVTDEDSMAAGVRRILAEQGRIDLLVNNAGYGSYGALEDVPLTEARRQFEVNLFGLARLTQLVLPQMRARGSGRIINLSSIGGKIYEPLGAWYHAAKFAVEGLSDSLRVELKPFGIDVVIIEPGPVRSEWNRISRDSMLAASAGTAYAAQARSVARVFAAADRPWAGAGPEAVARVIARAAVRDRPRARYSAGRGARAIIAARWLLPDRIFDAVITRIYLGRRSPAGT